MYLHSARTLQTIDAFIWEFNRTEHYCLEYITCSRLKRKYVLCVNVYNGSVTLLRGAVFSFCRFCVREFMINYEVFACIICVYIRQNLAGLG